MAPQPHDPMPADPSTTPASSGGWGATVARRAETRIEVPREAAGRAPFDLGDDDLDATPAPGDPTDDSESGESLLLARLIEDAMTERDDELASASTGSVVPPIVGPAPHQYPRLVQAVAASQSERALLAEHIEAEADDGEFDWWAPEGSDPVISPPSPTPAPAPSRPSIFKQDDLPPVPEPDESETDLIAFELARLERERAARREARLALSGLSAAKPEPVAEPVQADPDEPAVSDADVPSDPDTDAENDAPTVVEASSTTADLAPAIAEPEDAERPEQPAEDVPVHAEVEADAVADADVTDTETDAAQEDVDAEPEAEVEAPAEPAPPARAAAGGASVQAGVPARAIGRTRGRHGPVASAGLFVLRAVTAMILGVNGLRGVLGAQSVLDLWANTVLPGTRYIALGVSALQLAVAVLLLLGITTRLAGLATFAVMVFTLVFTQWGRWSIIDPNGSGFIGEQQLLLAGVGFLLLCLGAGSWSVDRIWQRSRQRDRTRLGA